MSSVFVRRSLKSQGLFAGSLPVGAIFGKTTTKGDIGIEIEIEGRNLPHEEVTEYAPQWKYVIDHSLRGEDNGEYVLKKPIKFGNVPDALKSLWGVFNQYKTKFDDSNRTSVHIHLNCQSFYLNRLASFSALYFCFEELLTEWCGEYRVGNLFCLRSKDAPAIISRIRKLIQTSDNSISEHLHYSAFNIHSLSKFGSIEIRTLRGVKDPQVIQDWVDILQRLYDLSESFEDPRKICDMFSAEGPYDFFYAVLGDKADVLRNGLSWTDEQIKESLYEGIRLAQDICYASDWDTFKKSELKADPFGRKPAKVMNNMQAYSQADVYTELATMVGPSPSQPPPQSLNAYSTWFINNDGPSTAIYEGDNNNDPEF
jgi:hypothetical protein